MIQTVKVKEVYKKFHNVEVLTYPNVMKTNLLNYMKAHGKLPFTLTMRTRWNLFKGRLKSYTMKKFEMAGSATIRFENSIPVKIERKTPCTCRVTYYLFKVPIYQRNKDMSDNEIINFFKE